MHQSCAYLLISHGSRDPRSQVAVTRLAKFVAERLECAVTPHGTIRTLRSGNAGVWQPENLTGLTAVSGVQAAIAPPSIPLVETAVLELHPLPLSEQIRQVGERAMALGYPHLRLVPLFLLPGMHVMDDIPAEVAIAQQALGTGIILKTCSHLGSHPRLERLLEFPPCPAPAARILISHGSRRSGGNAPVAAIAAHLGAHPAYWSTPPRLESQVTALVKQGWRDIVILPYFLFAGGITDAIAQTVHHLAQQFPEVRLHFADPLGASDALAALVVDLPPKSVG